MTSASARFEPMTAGVLLDRALQLYWANFSLMPGITAVAYVPFYWLMLAIDSALDFNAASSIGLGIGLGTMADWIVPAETGEKSLLSSALDSFVAILFTPFFEIATILLYYDLRMRQERFDLDRLSRAFAPQPRSLAGAPAPGD